MPKSSIKTQCLLKKYPGKGGWTYAEVPRLSDGRDAAFGWTRVKGSIDGYKFSQYNLMPMKNGNLFFPVKAEIRKQIKKQAGDTVSIVLYPDNSSIEIPAELDECLQAEPAAHRFFTTLKDSEQKAYISWIYEAKKDETRAERIVKAIDRLLKKQKMPRPY